MTQPSAPRPPRHLLVDVLPELAAELKRLLTRSDEEALADSIDLLAIVDRCRCGDDFCATFYTAPRPAGSYGASHRCIDLDADDGILVLDVEHEQVVSVEVLFRAAVRERLHQVLG